MRVVNNCPKAQIAMTLMVSHEWNSVEEDFLPECKEKREQNKHHCLEMTLGLALGNVNPQQHFFSQAKAPTFRPASRDVTSAPRRT
eukprot:4062270-Amphidinium_carterae.1